MSQDVSNQIRNFQYNMTLESHRQFLQAAFSIGMIPKDPNAGSYDFDSDSSIEIFLEGQSIKIIPLAANNIVHHKFVWYGLTIRLFPSTFLEYLTNGMGDSTYYFASENSKSVRLLMHGVEQALREAFGLPSTQTPSTQTEVPCKKNFSQ